MRSRFRAPLALAALLAGLLLATGCQNPANPDAATVDGRGIGRDIFLDDARAFAAVEGDPYQLAVDTDHAYSASGMASLLRDKIIASIISQAGERFGLTVGDADLAAAEEQLGIYATLPDEQRDFIVRQIAMQGKVLDYVGANEWWDDDDIARFGDALGDVACVKHILLAAREEADEVVALLRDGDDFATLAEERSTDTASGSEGGDLGCQPEGTFIAEFESAYVDAADGALIGPVETTAGFHVILVDSGFRRPTDDETRALVESRFATGTDGWVDYVLRTTDVDVDRRYGTWDSEAGSVISPEGAQAPAGNSLDLSS